MILGQDKRFYKKFWRLTLGLAGQNLITYSVSMADNVMLGVYSQEALSGAAIVNQLQFFLQMLVAGAGTGVMILGAQYWGKRQLQPIFRITQCGLIFGVCIGAAMWLAGLAVPKLILGMLTNDGPILEEGVRYLRVVSFTYPLFAASTILLHTLRSIEIVRVGLYTWSCPRALYQAQS